MSHTLKPCPFCNSPAELYSATCRHPNEYGVLQDWWVVDCSECNASIEYNDTPEEAAENWNTRYEQPTLIYKE